MFSRKLAQKVTEAAKSFYAVTLVGPRQSGKTTLLKYLFPDYEYLNMEDPDTLAKVSLDPKGYFANTEKEWIIDEAQEYPELFSYLLGIIDKNKLKGQFILSGSKNFILLEKISQSLAGRVAVLELLPLTFSELQTDGDYAKSPPWQLIYQGTYPGPYHNQIDTELWYKSYITTYLQRDVRQIIKIKDLAKFHLFLKLCAGRHGQLINLSELGSACGISHTTAGEWITLLEASYILFKLQPFYKNFNKRLIKTPKLYFYDSGLVCHLLGIESAEHAKIHSARGALFEGYIISEVAKQSIANAKTPNIYFWNNKNGFEIDLLIEQADIIKAVKIKSSSTFNKEFLTQLNKWQALIGADTKSPRYIVYSGDEDFIATDIEVVSYKNIQKLMSG